MNSRKLSNILEVIGLLHQLLFYGVELLYNTIILQILSQDGRLV
jgi:hypothetical protein